MPSKCQDWYQQCTRLTITTGMTITALGRERPAFGRVKGLEAASLSDVSIRVDDTVVTMSDFAHRPSTKGRIGARLSLYRAVESPVQQNSMLLSNLNPGFGAR